MRHYTSGALPLLFEFPHGLEMKPFTFEEILDVGLGLFEEVMRYRVFVVISRQTVLDSRFSTAICAPLYSSFDGLSTQIPVGIDEGLKHDSSIRCDELISLPKGALTQFIGLLSLAKIDALDRALAIAVGLRSTP